MDDEKEVRIFHAHKELLSGMLKLNNYFTGQLITYKNSQFYLHFIARNEVFRSMFENNEMKEVKEGHVENKDISTKTMEWFLK